MTTDTATPANDTATTEKTVKARAAKAGTAVKKAANDAATKSRAAASKAAKRIDEATETTVDSAKRHPVAAAAIAVGTAAAVAGAAFGVSKLVEKKKPAAPRKRKPAAAAKPTPKPNGAAKD